MFKINNYLTLRPLQAQLLPFIERLEKGLFANKFNCRAVLFLKMRGKIRCSILQNVKMPWRLLLLSAGSGGGTSLRELQDRTLGALGTPQRVAASSPDLMRLGSAGCAATHGLCSWQICCPFPLYCV